MKTIQKSYSLLSLFIVFFLYISCQNDVLNRSILEPFTQEELSVFKDDSIFMSMHSEIEHARKSPMPERKRELWKSLTYARLLEHYKWMSTYDDNYADSIDKEWHNLYGSYVIATDSLIDSWRSRKVELFSIKQPETLEWHLQEYFRGEEKGRDHYFFTFDLVAESIFGDKYQPKEEFRTHRFIKMAIERDSLSEQFVYEVSMGL